MKNVISMFFILLFATAKYAVASDISDATENEKDALVSSQIYIAKQDYENALNVLQPFVTNSLEAKFLSLELTNPDYRRDGVQNWSTNYEEEYREILFAIENAKPNTLIYKNLKDFQCSVLQSYIYEIITNSKEAEGFKDLAGVSKNFFSCLGRANAQYFTTYAPLLIWDIATEVKQQDRRFLAKNMYDTAIDLVMLLQASLTVLNYELGEIDGKYGNKTYSAFVQYQLDNKGNSPIGMISLDEVLVVYNQAKAGQTVVKADEEFLDNVFERLVQHLDSIEAFDYFSVKTAQTRGNHSTPSQDSSSSKLQEKLNTGLLAAEMKFWESVQKQNSKEFYVAYLEKYPKGTFAPLAKLLMPKFSSNRKENAIVEKITTNYKALILLCRAR